MTAETINRDDLKKALQGDKESFKRVENHLTKVKAIAKPRYIYTMFTEGNKVLYGVSAAPKAWETFRVDATKDGATLQMMEQIKTKGAYTNFVTDSDWGHVISTYIAIYDSNNDFICALGIDVEYEEYESRTNKNSLKLIMWGSLTISFGLIGVLLWNKKRGL